MNHLLLWLVILPLIGVVSLTGLPERYAKSVALFFSALGLILAGLLYGIFDASQGSSMQLVYTLPWIARFQIHFALGVDGLSLLLVLLTKFMVPISILASWSQQRHCRAFMNCFLILDTAMTGTFLATDIVLFYVFWELVLIPMVLMIGIWGSKERIYAALKFFLMTFAGSLLMLVAIFWIFSIHYEQYGFYSADIRSFYQLTFSPQPMFWGLNAQELVFLAFTIAFAIKIPLFPFHTWLPDAHVQAPTGGSILLAAVLLKMGTYGLLRFCIPIAPEAFVRFIPLLVVLSLIGILYGAWVAFQQPDMKKLVAYSSVSHVGFLVLGICAMNTEALTGSVLQMVNHGLSTGALFLLVGILYERRHSRMLDDFGGLAKQVPWYAFFLVLVACSSMGVPGLNGFVGEFLILLGTFQTNPLWGAIATLGVIFAAVYLLWMVRAVLWGPIRSEENKRLTDINARECGALIAISIFIIWLGVYPKPFLNKIETAMQSYWQHPKTVVSILKSDTTDRERRL